MFWHIRTCVRTLLLRIINLSLKTINFLNDLKALFIIYKYIKQYDIQIVVGHSPKGALLSMIASKIAHVRTRIYYRHGYIYTPMHGLKRAFFKIEEKLVSGLATIIVNVSPSIGKIAIRESINRAEKQCCLGHGTCGGIDTHGKFNPDLIDDLTRRSIAEWIGIHENDYVIGFCGRLCPDKGICELVEGYQLLKKIKKKKSLKLLLVGPYDERDVLPDRTKNQIKNDPSIIVTGYIDHNLQYYYSLMDVFVFPSYREGFGISVIEASSMGIPVIVSKSHGCIDSIVEYTTGEYVDISSNAICAKINQFINNARVTNKYGESGRQDVIQKYDYSIIWPLILSFYNSL